MRQFTTSILTATVIALAGTTAAFPWGAIAVDDSEGDSSDDIGYGMVTQAPSRQAAINGAMNSCQNEANNEDCKIVLVFKGCGAYAASSDHYGVASGANLASAQKRAISACGDRDCVVVVSDCD